MTLRLLNKLKCWKTIPIFSRTLFRSTFLAVISQPSTIIFPPLASSRRFRHLKNVDFPEPEGPMTTTTSPSLTSTEISLSTSKSPNDFFSPTVFIFISLSSLTPNVKPPFNQLRCTRKYRYYYKIHDPDYSPCLKSHKRICLHILCRIDQFRKTYD